MPKQPAPKIKRSWVNGAKGFWQWVADVKPKILTKGNRYTVFEAEPWQREIINQTLATDDQGDFLHNLALLITPRRHGKTNLNALIVLWLTTTRLNHVTQILGNTEEHARRVQFKTVCGIVRHTPKLQEFIPEAKILKNSLSTIDTLNSTIQLTAVNMASAFGDKLNVLWVGDFHACPDTDPFDAFQASLLDSDNTLCLIDSNPDSEGGHVHRLEMEAGEDRKTFCHRVEYADFETYCKEAPHWIDRDKAAKLQRTQLETAFKRDILGQRTAAINSLFTSEQIKACISGYSLPVTPDLIPEMMSGRAFVIGCGLDKARAHRTTSTDKTVWTVLLKTVSLDDGEPEYWVIKQDTYTLGFNNRLKKLIKADHEAYKPVGIALEQYETDELFSWGLDNGYPVDSGIPTAQRQYQLFRTLHEIVADGRLHFSKDCKALEKEMKTFQYDDSKRVTSFGHAKGCHDDHIYSLAWAIWAMRDKELAIYELPYFHCEGTGHLTRFCYLRGGTEEISCRQYCEGHYRVQQMFNQYKALKPQTEFTLPDFYKAKVSTKGGGPILSAI